MDERTKGIILMLLASIGFGTYPLIIKFLSINFSPIIQTFVVYFISTIIIIPLFFKSKKIDEFIESSLKTKLLAISVGFFAIIISWLSLVNAIGLIGATVPLTIVQMQPIFVLLLGLLFLKEKINKTEMIATALVLIAIPIIGIGNLSFNVTVYGLGLSLISCISFAICTVLGRYLAKEKLSPITILTARIISGTLLLLPLLLFVDINEFFKIGLNELMFFLGIVITGSLVPYFLYYESLKRIKAITGSVLEVFAPIITAIGAYLIFAEILAITQYFGIALAIIGILIMTMTKEKNN